MTHSNSFTLNILTPDKAVYSGMVNSLVAPGEAGSLGILAQHAPFIGTLKQGPIVVKQESGKTFTFEAKGKGFLEVFKNKVVLLIDDIQ